MGAFAMRTVRFLEELGTKPQLSEVEYGNEVAALNVGDDEREVLLGRDASKLASLLGGRAKMWCAIMTPNDVPAEDQPVRDEPGRDEPEPDSQLSR